MSAISVSTIKVMPNGQITLPKEIRQRLGLSVGDRVAIYPDGEQVIMMNSAVYAMKQLQHGMIGEAERTGLVDDAAIDALVSEVRGEMEGL